MQTVLSPQKFKMLDSRLFWGRHKMCGPACVYFAYLFKKIRDEKIMFTNLGNVGMEEGLIQNSGF